MFTNEQIPVSLSGTKDRLGYIGKENDVESGLGDFGVRKYDTEGGRFLSIDPLWEKYYAWSPYHYCGNNPVNGSDPSGLLPGDLFKEKHQARHDFAKNYINLTKKNKVEYGAMIYSINVDGETFYSYTIPEKGGPHEVTHTNEVPANSKIDSEIHTHPSNNLHSKDKDIPMADKLLINVYVVTQNGNIWEYNPFKGKIIKLPESVDNSFKDKRPIPEKDEIDESTGQFRK